MTVIHNKAVGIIKDLLKLGGITLTQAAFDWGMSLSRVSSIANGYTVPQDANCRKMIARYLNQPEDLIFPASMIKGEKCGGHTSTVPNAIFPLKSTTTGQGGEQC